MKTIIAIDPGKSGGIACRNPEGIVGAWKMPETEGDLIDLMIDLMHFDRRNCIVYLEEVGGFIKGNPAPGSAMFNFGRNFGYILGLCAGMNLPLHLVKPQRWQKELGIPTRNGAKAEEHKRNLKAEAQRRRPDLKVTLLTCDALLILDWAIIQPDGEA